MKATVFIDVQNDFVKGGSLAYGYPADDIVPHIADFARRCNERGHALFATRDTHDDSYPGTLEGRRLPVPHCHKNRLGWNVAPALDAALAYTDAFLLNKPTFGALLLPTAIQAEAANRAEPVEEIVICGFCTSICVVSNALLLRASYPNVPIAVVSDLCGDIDEASHNAALKVMANCQIDVRTVAELEAAQ